MALREKGVEKELASEALSNAVSDDAELRNAMAAAEKKARTIRTDDPKKWERSLASFLATRGFGWDVVGKVLEGYRNQRRTDANNQEELE
jgi:SOS response regulatory protein OraA/RecX